MCSDEGLDVEERIPDLVRSFFEKQGSSFVNASVLSDADAKADLHLFGIAIGPSIEGWVSIVETARSPSTALASLLAEELKTPVVISSIYEICDPPEPESVEVFGAKPDERFMGLYYEHSYRYRDFAEPKDLPYSRLRFAPNAVTFATFRSSTPVRDPFIAQADSAEEDIPF